MYYYYINDVFTPGLKSKETLQQSYPVGQQHKFDPNEFTLGSQVQGMKK